MRIRLFLAELRDLIAKHFGMFRQEVEGTRCTINIVDFRYKSCPHFNSMDCTLDIAYLEISNMMHVATGKPIEEFHKLQQRSARSPRRRNSRGEAGSPRPAAAALGSTLLKFDTLKEARRFLGTLPRLVWRDGPIRKDGLIKGEDAHDEPRPETKDTTSSRKHSTGKLAPSRRALATE